VVVGLLHHAGLLGLLINPAVFTCEPSAMQTQDGIHLLLRILADGEEQARLLGKLPDDPRLGAEHYGGVARQLQCTLGKAVSVAKAIEAASRSATDSPRSADEGSGGPAPVEAQERPAVVCKRRCVEIKLQKKKLHRGRVRAWRFAASMIHSLVKKRGDGRPRALGQRCQHLKVNGKD
jgi:hypothetical protein